MRWNVILPGKMVGLLVGSLIIIHSPLSASARSGGYASLGPRGSFVGHGQMGIPPALWSGKVVLKIRDGVQPRLAGHRILDQRGRLLLDLDRLVNGSRMSSSALLRVNQGFGMDLAWLQELRRQGQARCGCELADLTTYFSLYLDRGNLALRPLLSRLNAPRHVELAYAVVDRRLLPRPVDIPPTTPDYTSMQGYRGPAPGGIDAEYAASFPGGDGAGVSVADIEIGWQWDHEDLETCLNGLIDLGTLYTDDYSFIDHGTAVLGQIFAQDNGYGVIGLAPGAGCHFAPDYTYENGNDIPGAMLAAMQQRLSPGDVMLLEAQTFGPNYDEATYAGLVPVEWDAAEYDTIRTAVTNGYIVVEAGANGWEDLDDPIYQGHFDISQYDSGAIMVAAGTSPDTPPAHVPEWYTNWGSRMDVHAWGSSVTTLGYGDLFDGNGDQRQRYTAEFAGTSSASPIVAAAAAIISAIAKSRGLSLTPTQIREVLTLTGTPQHPDPKAIGPQPDLRGAIATLAVCGDGEVEGEEVCDDGNTADGDGCSADCSSDESCGNGILDSAAGEVCDDGNTVDGDGCSADCSSDESCGNGILDTAAGESCDDGVANGDQPDSCRGSCQLPRCGDGIVDPYNNEQCDDGNQVDGDGCSSTCRLPEKQGCGCRTSTAGPAPTLLLLLGLLVLLRLGGWRRR